MPSFLVNKYSQCCCPEMRCCTPETVSATLSGFSGTMLNIANVWPAYKEPFQQNCEIDLSGRVRYQHTDAVFGSWIYELDMAGSDCVYAGGCTTPIPGSTQYALCEGSIYQDMFELLWPSVCFPQHTFNCENFAFEQYNGCAELPACASQGHTINEYFVDTNWRDTYGFSCTDVVKLCQKPMDAAVHYGKGATCVHLPDLNDTYACHRDTVGLRPELHAVVRRTVQAARAVPIDDDTPVARLLFESFCRREWQFDADCESVIIIRLSCSTLYPPPESPPGTPSDPPGKWMAIDYRCGPRVPGPPDTNFACDQYMCTAPNGFVWPHLRAYHETGNISANIRLVLTPELYMNGEMRDINTELPTDKMRRPYSWRVAQANILDGGSGHEVGEFFFVTFDTAWMSTLDGIPQLVGFPELDKNCGLPVSWQDKYGASADILDGVKRYFQRLRVSGVDGDGAITELEIVPWYKNPDYGEDCIPVSLPNDKRVKHYPSYCRALCHPLSVDLGGKGYLVGDQIKFFCGDPACVTHTEAVAVVSDVDDEGAVLDWFVSGSDRYLGGYGGGDPTCAVPSPDNRGAYKFDGKELCVLRWTGLGVPVRAVDTIRPCFGFMPAINRNISSLTRIVIQINRTDCRTSINFTASAYKYDAPWFVESASGTEALETDKMLRLWPPFPKFKGGGMIIHPSFNDAANESVIGGSLASGQVITPGAGYAFRDKSHVEPILPTAVPSIGGGSGARIASFQFAAVHNFPKPGYAAGEPFQPVSTRFSYFPVTAATIDAAHRGTGYEVDQVFFVSPEGGKEVTDLWRGNGGDNPDVDTNGSWYGGERASKIDANGYFLDPPPPLPGDPDPGPDGEPRQPLCQLRISSVNAEGGITGLEVLHGGMMFRPVWRAGVKHPSLTASVDSDTGSGAAVEIAVNTTLNSSNFGQVTGVTVVQSQQVDPLHPPALYPIGGRDYANPPGEMMWELQDLVAGAEHTSGWRLMSAVDWHNFAVNPYHPERSTHEVVEGQAPPLHRRALRCVLGECYHPLLNRTYTLHTIWGGTPQLQSAVDLQNVELCNYATNSYSPLPRPGGGSVWVNGRPPTNYAVCKRKNKTEAPWVHRDPDDPPLAAGDPCAYPAEGDIAQWNDYFVIQWGPTITLSHVLPNPCPDHTNGRTNR